MLRGCLVLKLGYKKSVFYFAKKVDYIGEEQFMTVFLWIRIAVIPILMILVHRKYLRFVLLNILLMPFLWLLFYFFYSEPALTCLFASAILIYCAFSDCFIKFKSDDDISHFKRLNRINCFELVLIYFPSALFSSFGFYSCMHFYFLGWRLI